MNWIGTVKQSRKEWISDEAWELVEMKRTARLSGKIDEYKSLCKKCKSQLKSDKQRWADEKAEAGEAALSNGQLKDAFANFRQLWAATTTV